MASAAEQLAANINFGAFAKATELKKRILFTLAALVVYRIGTYLPLPGIDTQIMDDIFNQNQGGILGMLDVFAGGAFGRMSIFALNIMPYISASIIMQLMTSVSPKMEALKKEGESGRKTINQYTRYLTVLLATFQAYGLAIGMENLTTAAGQSAVFDPGMFFRATAVITLLGGTMFLMWLGEQITARGIGNGISLIIFAGIVAELPRSLAFLFEQVRIGAMSVAVLFGIVIMVVSVIAFVVFMERAQRRVIVQYPKRQMGNRMYGGDSTHLPLKLNTSGVIPPIFASALLLLPLSAVGLAGGTGPGWLQSMSAMLQHGQPLFMALYAGLIVFFAFFYTAITFNPGEVADNLRKYGGFVPGTRPGQNTADYLERILNRITVIGAAYLVVVCMIPELLISQNASVPFYFGGTSLLIVVTVTMDTVSQIHSHMLAHQYEGLVKKSKLRGRR
ncbi:MAG: preprotein translocase subunit SecY [Alphaproteobacteria bacterium]|nr:preprotein translocase subunit SecY [Alphaproteobacteria bacterium]MAX94911.1 preprotein translocase subunit SecY [Alphaproteobacteria bacterium]MBN53636.1 preprotein translocase subunit SecY [Alphaproteobacteria bacterium]OUT41620.1 MAG: preprotein translocase subunit SecY [Micavibrio sp. TMED2]|tara:strand:+ start:43594 stop:44940 length:1347 start_codon:yes stop_codon:yes gene_type:complete